MLKRRQPKCPFRPVAASWTCSLDGVKAQHGPCAALNACGNGNKAPTGLRVRTQTTSPRTNGRHYGHLLRGRIAESAFRIRPYSDSLETCARVSCSR